MSNEFKSTLIRKRQLMNLAIVIAVLLILAMIVKFLLDSPEPKKEEGKLDTIAFSSPVDHIDTQTYWIEHTENALKAIQQDVDLLKNHNDSTQLEDKARISALEEQHKLLEEAFREKALQTTSKEETQAHLPSEKLPSAVLGSGIDSDEIHLKPTEVQKKPLKNADNFVPAGTFAEAIMLGAADASAGVTAQANPSPMVFRIMAEGTLPNEQKSHLKDCVVTAAVVGDISSERGEIRLERMSCVFPNGQVVEQPVEGTVFGMDAKNGVRGDPVWREGALLGRAVVAGTLSGFANGVSQRYTTSTISPLGTTQTTGAGDIFKVGAAQGASNAMEKLADYNIKRAEQYHPVIQLSAGQPCDIVFLKGFYLDGRKNDTSDETVPSELFPSPKNAAVEGLTLTEQELQKINAHEKALRRKDDEGKTS